MISSAPPPALDSDLRSSRFRDLRAHPDFASPEIEGQGIDQLLRAFLLPVYGLASAIVPEEPAAPERIATAVFQTFLRRWRKLPKRTVVAVWIFQTTLIAARAERKRLRLDKLAGPVHRLILDLNRLAPKLRNPVLLTELLQLPQPSAAAALGLSEKRLVRRRQAGLKKLAKRATKLGISVEALREILILCPDELAARLRTRLQPSESPMPLTRRTLAGWRWLRFRVFLKRALAVAGATVGVLALLFGTFAFLATHGYLTAFFIEMGQKQALKEFPEMRLPARPWPSNADDHALARSTPPRDSQDLFQITNIWTATLTFTPDQWKAIEPSTVRSVGSIVQDGRIILRNPNAKRSGLAGALGYEFNWTEAQLDFAGEKFDRVGVRFRGNGTYVNSLYGNKQSLKVDINKHAKDQRLANVRELNFLNAIVDYSYLHDALAEQLFRELGAVAPRTAYAYVTVDVPGAGGLQPRGLFVLMENIDTDFAQDRFGTKKVPIFKPVTYDLFEDIGDDWSAYEAIYDLKTKATPEQQQRVVDFSKLVSHATDEDFARQLPGFLDLEEFAAFLAGHVLLSSYDGFLVNGQNFYVYLDPRSNKFGFIPWDQDHAWGDFGHMGTNHERENASIWRPAVHDFTFLHRVLNVEAFRTVYRAKLESALAAPFTRENLYPAIDLLARRIRPAVAAESDFRLKRFDQAVSDQWLPGPRDGQAEGPKAPVHQIKRFIENRIQSVRDQLDGKSQGARLKGFR